MWRPVTSAQLGSCDWVACLRPPPPPPHTHLRISHWFGDPVQFGVQAMYVCARGYRFLDDPEKTHQNYTCQDGNRPGFEDKRYHIFEKVLRQDCLAYKVFLDKRYYFFN